MRHYFLACFLSGFVFFTAAQAQNAGQAALLKQILELPAPPPVSETAKPAKREHPPEFYASENIPSDDAPIEDLIDYWQRQNSVFDEFRYNQAPSKETVARLLAAIEKDAAMLPGYLNLLPAESEIADVVKRLYQSEQESKNFGQDWSNRVRGWLRNNSDLFVGELVEAAKKMRVENERIDDQDDLIALAKVDWESAKPIVDALENDPSRSELFTLAKYVLYHHAVKTGDSGDIERYRDDLKKLVENREAPYKTRDLAMDALVLGGDFAGRDEWYFSLLEDETLLELQENGFTGLTTLVRHIPNNREKWLPAMLRLLESNNPTLRSVAVRNISQINGFRDKEILKKMLPWLTDRKWVRESRENERGEFISALGDFDIPESIPGLIAVVSGTEEEYRAEAARALIAYKSVEATGALRRLLLTEKDMDLRRSLIEALVETNGFSDEEMIDALETYAVSIVKSSEETEDESDAAEEEKPIPVEISLGYYLTELQKPTDGLVSRTISRIKTLQPTAPDVALYLQSVMEKWQHPLVDLEMLGWMNSARADAETVLKLLIKRDEMRVRVPNDLALLRERNSVLRALCAVLLEDRTDFVNILNSTEAEPRAALLAVARLVRLKLPIQRIAPLLAHENKLLALAAERYLEMDDSREARSLLIAHRKAETPIFGARQGIMAQDAGDFEDLEALLNKLFVSVNNTNFNNLKLESLKKTEKNLRQEIAASSDLLAVYAFIGNGSPKSLIVRCYRNKVVLTDNEDSARYWEKDLSAKEYEAIIGYIVEKRIDELAPVNAEYANEKSAGEFLMFGRDGGRRVYFQGFARGTELDGLAEMFRALNAGERRLHYRLADKIGGLEVLHTDPKFYARAVWKNGADLRLLVEDKALQQTIGDELKKQENAESQTEEQKAANYESRRERRTAAAYKHFAWRAFSGGKLGDVNLAEPAEIRFLTAANRDRSLYYAEMFVPDPSAYMRQTADGEIASLDSALVKYERSGAITVLKDGNYENPIVSADKKWLVAASAETSFYKPNGVVRINLATGKETRVNLPPADDFYPVAAVAVTNKVLLYRARNEQSSYGQKDNPSPKSPEYYLLDPATGAVQMVKGDFRPLEQQQFRALQPAAAPNEFWAAVYDEKQGATVIGHYNMSAFSFKPLVTMPDIYLDSMNIWVDEPAAKIYFVYEGHLLAAPLKSPQK